MENKSMVQYWGGGLKLKRKKLETRKTHFQQFCALSCSKNTNLASPCQQVRSIWLCMSRRKRKSIVLKKNSELLTCMYRDCLKWQEKIHKIGVSKKKEQCTDIIPTLALPEVGVGLPRRSRSDCTSHLPTTAAGTKLKWLCPCSLF